MRSIVCQVGKKRFAIIAFLEKKIYKKDHPKTRQFCDIPVTRLSVDFGRVFFLDYFLIRGNWTELSRPL